MVKKLLFMVSTGGKTKEEIKQAVHEAMTPQMEEGEVYFSRVPRPKLAKVDKLKE